LNDFGVFLRGVAVGLAVAVPVGPIALLCMRRTLERGFGFGFATGVGAATADLFYSAIAAFGIAAVEAALVDYQLQLRLVGGIFLLVLAARTAVSQRRLVREPNARAKGVFGALLSGLVLTATNPLTVLGFAAIFASFGVGDGLVGGDRALALVCGVFAGSAAWWLTLTSIVARIRHLFSPRTFGTLNLCAAALLTGFGFYALISALMMAAPWLF